MSIQPRCGSENGQKRLHGRSSRSGTESGRHGKGRARAEAGKPENARLVDFASLFRFPAPLAQGRGAASQHSSQCENNMPVPLRVQKAEAPPVTSPDPGHWGLGGQDLGALLLLPEPSKRTGIATAKPA